jgi:hypothetical protein
MKQDMERVKDMCEDRLLGGSDYEIFKEWPDINWSRDRYIRIRDGLVLEGEVQEMKENFCNEEPYKACVCGFFVAYHQVLAYHWCLLFHPMDLECFCKFEVS